MKIKLSTLLLLLMLSATCFSCQDDDLDEIKLDKDERSKKQDLATDSNDYSSSANLKDWWHLY
jgi:hypothetical protein